MSSFVQAVIKANQEIYSALKANDASLMQMGKMGAGGDISSGADMLCESIFVSHLSEYGTIDSEESGIIGEGKAKIIIDPLDGSSNYLSNFPYYGTSVAKIDKNGTVESAIVCNLTNGDIFIKNRDQSLSCQNILSGDIISNKEVRDSKIGLFEKAYQYPKIVAELKKIGYKFRSPGATALSLAYAKDVNFFLFVGKAREYDFVAGLALCEEMFTIVEDEYVIVTKEKDIFDNLNEIVNRSIK